MTLLKLSPKECIWRLLAVALLFSNAWPAAGGYLWLAGEFAAPFSIYRYNIQTGAIDKIVQPTFGGSPLDASADVYNNLAYDGTHLYVGSDDNTLFATADPLTGAILSKGTYSPTPNPASSWEDGAYNRLTGTLWRAGTTPTLLETTVTGSVVARFNVVGTNNLDGLEWIGNILYATTFTAFGSISFSGSTATFHEIFGPGTIPIGYPPDQLPLGLALDQETGLLYMASSNTFFGGSDNFLWTVNPVAGSVTFVRDLVDAGYPSTGTGGGQIIPDAMGWVPTAVPEPSTLALLTVAIVGFFGYASRPQRRFSPYSN